MNTLRVVIQTLGGFIAYLTLAVLLFGLLRGTRRAVGTSRGKLVSWLRSPWFYLITTVIFLGLSAAAWIEIPNNFSENVRTVLMLVGALIFFPGMFFVLWARLTLGKNYFASSGFGAQLFADHQLVTTGPYAVVRHPMYIGMILAGVGSLLIYLTWTTLLFAIFAPFTLIRTRNEERILAEAFGAQWQEYCRHVSAFFPVLRKR